jgi:hypothetical protein
LEGWDRLRDYRFRFKELAIVKMIPEIEENQRGVFSVLNLLQWKKP